MAEDHNITLLLERSESGDQKAHDELYGIVYAELYRMTKRHKWQGGETMRPTALVNEAYLKLMGSKANFQNRGKLFAHAALAMRQLILNAAEKKRALKRGGDQVMLTLQEWDQADDVDVDVYALNECLVQLEEVNPRFAQIINLHYFVGLKNREIAQVLSLAESTVYQDLKLAKAWLRRKMQTFDQK